MYIMQYRSNFISFLPEIMVVHPVVVRDVYVFICVYTCMHMCT